LSRPQAGQRLASGAPHMPQKRWSAAFICAQRWHFAVSGTSKLLRGCGLPYSASSPPGFHRSVRSASNGSPGVREAIDDAQLPTRDCRAARRLRQRAPGRDEFRGTRAHKKYPLRAHGEPVARCQTTRRLLVGHPDQRAGLRPA
jgi:hypothetical protein